MLGIKQANYGVQTAEKGVDCLNLLYAMRVEIKGGDTINTDIADRIKLDNYLLDKGFKTALALDDKHDDDIKPCLWCGEPLIRLQLIHHVAFVCDNWQCQLFRSPQKFINLHEKGV
jgi:hypothetical protein